MTTLEIDSTNHSINRGSTTTVVTVVAHNEVEPTMSSVVENRNVETECDDSTLFYITEAEDDAVDQDDSVDHDPDQYSSYMDVDYLDDANEIVYTFNLDQYMIYLTFVTTVAKRCRRRSIIKCVYMRYLRR